MNVRVVIGIAALALLAACGPGEPKKDVEVAIDSGAVDTSLLTDGEAPASPRTGDTTVPAAAGTGGVIASRAVAPRPAPIATRDDDGDRRRRDGGRGRGKQKGKKKRD